MTAAVGRPSLRPSAQGLLLALAAVTMLAAPLPGIAVAAAVAVIGWRRGARVMAVVAAAMALVMLALALTGLPTSTEVTHSVS